MTREEFMDIVYSELHSDGDNNRANRIIDAADEYAEEQTRWIPVKWHEITDEERECECYTKDLVYYFDCIMPEDEQEILITVKDRQGRLWVEKDTCYVDDGFYLDSGYDWVEDVVAWCELPEPYKSEILTGSEGSDKE